jgi:hypothetical protein
MFTAKPPSLASPCIGDVIKAKDRMASYSTSFLPVSQPVLPDGWFSNQ